MNIEIIWDITETNIDKVNVLTNGFREFKINQSSHDLDIIMVVGFNELEWLLKLEDLHKINSIVITHNNISIKFLGLRLKTKHYPEVAINLAMEKAIVVIKYSFITTQTIHNS